MLSIGASLFLSDISPPLSYHNDTYLLPLPPQALEIQ